MADATLATRRRAGGDDTIVWIHGYTLSSEVWSRVWDALPENSHIGIDLPGHGASPSPTHPVSAAEVADSIADIAIKHGATHLVAMSFGGIVGIEAAIRHPEAFATLTLASPALGGGPQDAMAQTRHLELLELHRNRGPGPWLAEAWMRSPPDIFTGARRQPLLWAQLRALIDRHRWDELQTGNLASLFGHPQSPRRLATIHARTLLLIGEEDIPAFGRAAQMIFRALPHCERRYLDCCGHLCMLEDPLRGASFVSTHVRGEPHGLVRRHPS
jgi:pimeloyl-ACP methyl ester carboxylesterase